MGIKIKNFIKENDNIEIVEHKGAYTVFQHLEDKSVVPSTAEVKYYMAQMNCTVKQCLINCSKGIKLQKGAMQMMLGDVEMTTGVKGVGDLVGKAFKGKVTGEAAIKPEYRGDGNLITEPTYKHLLLEDLAEWGGHMVCDDGMFYACDMSVKDTVQMRNTLSSAVGGKEGLFNCAFKGNGIVLLESWYPRKELYEVYVENDTVKIDGNNAVAWSGSLQFTVERSGKSLMGSAASGEGLVNVYRGTGKILVAPRT